MKRIIFLGFLVKIVVNRPLFIEVIGSFQAGPGLFLGGICRNLAGSFRGSSEEAVSEESAVSVCLLLTVSSSFRETDRVSEAKGYTNVRSFVFSGT